MKLPILISCTFLLFSSCIVQDTEIKTEKIINSLKENRSQAELEKLDKSLNVMKTYSLREKLNKPDLYDMKLSVEGIYFQTLKNKSFKEIIDFSDQYLTKNKKRILYLEKEIKNRRVSTDNALIVEPVKMTSYTISEINNSNIEVHFESHLEEGGEIGYLYLVELYDLTNNEILQSIGYSDLKTVGIVHSQENSFSVNEMLSQEVLSLISESGVPIFPIDDLSNYGIGIHSYISEFKQDYDGAYKPRMEDDFESKKTLEELKKDLMKLKFLVNSLES